MNPCYPTPDDIGLKIPATLRKERFCRGFAHALKGGQLDDAEYFRLSFRIGYRTAKLYLREVRRHRGILQFPMRSRMRQRSIW